MQGAKVLITGPAGQIAFPLAEHLARDNDVGGSARVSDAASREKVEAVGVTARAVDLALAVAGLPGLRLTGLQTVGANTSDQAQVRSGYALLARLRDRLLASSAPGTADARQLSMGMSGDLEAAIGEGATVVRVGTAVFGARG